MLREGKLSLIREIIFSLAYNTRLLLSMLKIVALFLNFTCHLISHNDCLNIFIL